MFRINLLSVIRWFFLPGLLLLSVNPELSLGSNRSDTHAPGAQRIPPFYENIEGTEIPKTLSPEKFENTTIRRAYEVAHDHPELLMQLPCFCPCDRPEVSHKSLLDCFASAHAENCTICREEALTAATLQKENWSVKKIREKIIEDYSKMQH